MRLTVFSAFLSLTLAHLSTNVMQKLPFLRTEEQKGKYLFKRLNQNYFLHINDCKFLIQITKHIYLFRRKWYS